VASEPNDHRPLHFSTEQLPVENRISIWREEFGRQVLRLDVTPIPDVPFYAHLTMHSLPTLALASVTACGTHEQRTRELITDGNDAVGLIVNLSGPFHVATRGHDVTLGSGDAVLVSSAEPATYIHPSPGHAFALCIPHAALSGLVPDFEDQLGLLVSKSTGVLGLLTRYLCALADPQAPLCPSSHDLVTTHIHDLLAFALGAKREVREAAEERGIAAARLQAIKADILKSLGSRDLSLNALAARHRVTPRYVQRLFEREGASLTDFVLGERLARVHLLLRDARHAQRTISDIAFEVGFGDLSYFNRAFRKRFGMTPSEWREASQTGLANGVSPRDLG
jgi:AraC-like DNA-binding protein